MFSFWDSTQFLQSVVPNLGEFLALLTVSDKSWADIAEAYLSENMDRNVYWLVRAPPGRQFVGFIAVS